MVSIREYRGVDIQTTHRFRVIINNPPAGINVDDLNFYCTSAGFPAQELEEGLVNLGAGHDVKFAGKATPPVWTTSVILDTDPTLENNLRRWSRLCFDPVTSETEGRPNYIADATIQLLDGKGNVTREAKLIHIWIQSIAELTMDSASAEPARLEVTWNSDSVEHVTD